jgi:magnesium transporter
MQVPGILNNAWITMTTYQLKCPRFLWINIVSPTKADVDQLHQLYPQIRPLHLEDLLSQTERPKVDEEKGYLLVVMQFPHWDRDQHISRASEVEFIVGKDFLVTVHDGGLKPLVRIFARCELYESERVQLFGKGANDAFYGLVDQMVDYLFPILRKVDIHLHEIEDHIFTGDARQVIRDIAIVRRDIIALRRMIRHQVPIIEGLEKTEHQVIREDLEEYFGDTVDHLYAARDIIDEDYEVIGSLAETADSLLSHRINEVMRVLTVISVIMLPLTLISGIYGMNIDLPLSQHPAAFIFVVGLMLTITTVMLTYFKYRKWL